MTSSKTSTHQRRLNFKERLELSSVTEMFITPERALALMLIHKPLQKAGLRSETSISTLLPVTEQLLLHAKQTVNTPKISTPITGNSVSARSDQDTSHDSAPHKTRNADSAKEMLSSVLQALMVRKQLSSR
jgi:hypothetical protein